MTFKLNLDLENFWSITDKGELCVELCPKNRPDDVKAEFTFCQAELVDALEDDIGEKFKDPSFELDEWDDLISWLKRTAEVLEEIKRNAFE